MRPGFRQTVLIVDDVPINIKALAQGLKDDYEIQIANNGLKALDIALSDTPPDLILLDIQMPGLDGFTVCRRLKSDDRTRDIPIIFITSREAEEDEVRGLEMGAVDYITKPFVLQVVRARVRIHLELKRKNDLLESLVMLDGLTEIHNRRFFDEALEQEWRRNLRTGTVLALIMADIDFFKKYNDCYGHPAGDKCLRRVARILQSVCRRPGDVAARYGGEEFAVLLPGVQLEAAAQLAEEIRKKVIALQISHEDTDSNVVGVSLGVAAIIPDYSSTPLDLVDGADDKLYLAKKNGRNRVEY